jgi:hypothetical protein
VGVGGVLGKGEREWNEDKGSPQVHLVSTTLLLVFFLLLLLRIIIMGAMRGTENRNAPLLVPRSGLGADASGGWRVYISYYYE